MDKSTFLNLYKSLVRSILEYGNCVWSPLYKRQSISIENVQRRATKRVQGLFDFSYEERLSYLNLPSLKYRRIRGDLIQLYKLVHGFDNLESSDILKFSHNVSTRGDKYKLYFDRFNTNVRQNAFPLRIIGTWNSLSLGTKDSGSVNCFKNSVDGELFDLKYVYDD